KSVTDRDLARLPYSAGKTVASVPSVSRAPATRTVPSVPVAVPKSPANFDTDLGAMPSLSAFMADFGTPPTMAQSALPGPSASPKGQERLAASVYPDYAVATLTD